MTINTEDLLNSILESLDRIEYIKPEDIPNIDLYMDQVTTFMDRKLRATVRYPDEDKVLTKTMINNYAKNELLPPPVKKKYSKEHVLLLVFIYYYKSILSISDIQTLLRPITERFFQSGEEFNLERVYEDVFGMGENLVARLKEEIKQEYKESEEMFPDASEENKEFLQKFAFICRLSFDVYVKKLIIEKLVDELAAEQKLSEEKNDKKSSKEK
uniref:DUF1836 domain-containing protein n=1 Tax=Acetatifactor sp. TaxID=1872090 RepID=UPI004056E395